MTEEKQYKWTPENPNPRSIEKVKNPLPVPTVCPHCGGPVVLGGHADVYGGRVYGNWPYVYMCQDKKCDSYVGLHPFTNIPLGTLANKETRNARKRCKPIFENLWRFKNSPFERGEAYAWLADSLGIEVEQCHFGWFDIETCRRAYALCHEKLNHGSKAPF